MAIETSRRHFMAAGGVATALAATGAGATSGTRGSERNYDEVFDVVVIGAGAAGCVAALTAHEAGAKVVVLEKAVVPGGTSAKSGGSIWIPNHPWLAAEKTTDPRGDFLAMAARSAFPHTYDPTDAMLGIPEMSYRLFETFYDNGSQMVSMLADIGALRTEVYRPGGGLLPDYRAELAENKRPTMRMLQPVRRFADGPDAGDELMAQLLGALAKRDVAVRTRSRVTALIQESDARVSGVTVDRDDGSDSWRIGARGGVVFATGGFAHNPELQSRFQYAPVFGGCAAPTSTGDIVPIAASVGAQFANMSCAWRAPVILDEVAQYVSAPCDVFMIGADSMITVNRFGRRCGNERRAYQDRVLTMYRWDETAGEYPDLIQFVVYDARAAELFAGSMPIPPTPTGMDYIIEGKDLEELGQKIDERLVALADAARDVRLAPGFAAQLKSSITRFNRFAETGVDQDFGRGSGIFDKLAIPTPPSTRWRANDKPNPVMYPLTEVGPYYAMILAPGVLDTNGGPVIDPAARILDNDDRPIPGLFGAGNCIASPARDAYMAAGTTLGMAMTFGMIAGRSSALAEPRPLS